MIDKGGIDSVRQEIAALFGRMQTRQQEGALEALMAVSEEELRSLLMDIYHSESGPRDLRHDAAYEARLVIARRASIATMEDRSSADSWLNERSKALGGQAPTSLLYSDEGLVRVLRALIAIEHGVPP